METTEPETDPRSETDPRPCELFINRGEPRQLPLGTDP